MAVMLIEAKIDLTLFFEDLYQAMLTPRAIITLRRNIVFPKKLTIGLRVMPRFRDQQV